MPGDEAAPSRKASWREALPFAAFAAFVLLLPAAAGAAGAFLSGSRVVEFLALVAVFLVIGWILIAKSPWFLAIPGFAVGWVWGGFRRGQSG